MSKPTFRYTFTIDEEHEEAFQKLLKSTGLRPAGLFRHFLTLHSELYKYGDQVTVKDITGNDKQVSILPKTRNNTHT